MDETKLRWGILGTGAIARTFASQLPRCRTGTLVAVASRSSDSANRFASEFRATRAHDSYDALLADDDVQAVYISTPHPLHAEWAIKTAQAKKHILCEKPLGLNHAEAMAIVEAAHDSGVFLMEAFMYRCAPQTMKLIELIRDERAIGDVRIIHATFGFHWPIAFDPSSRAVNHALGGGGILDVGCYPMSMARMIAGAATGKPFAEPINIRGVGHIGAQSRVDEWAVASVLFPNGIIAQLSTSVQCDQENVVRIDGSEGSITVREPWLPARGGDAGTTILVRRRNEPPREIVVRAEQPLYALEADAFAAGVRTGTAPYPAMSTEDSLGNNLALDRWRASIGLVYQMEKPEHFPHPANIGRTLPRSAAPMKYGTIAGVEKRISRLVMGCDNQPDFPHAAVMFDDFLSRGGNAFDTAHLYGGGRQEQLLGDWIRKRGVREDVVIIAKGGHAPYCTPTDLTTQLLISLERMQVDRAELYLLHRDNPDVPVGEFVDVLDEHVRAGRIGAFGGSNWTTARIDAANAYAKQRGRSPFSMLSNQFSLARMIEPPWGGCISASDADGRVWLQRTQTPLLAWSSQSRGFFLPGRASPEIRDDAELVRCWYSDDNFQRLARVNDLAKRLGVLPINIALAYVLHQPFPTFALIGPRRLSETRTSFAALRIELSDQEIRWLNLEA